jgi:hypothetical protein
VITPGPAVAATPTVACVSGGPTAADQAFADAVNPRLGAKMMAAGDVDGDGNADIVMAYQLGDGTFSYYVWRNGLTADVRYTSGSFSLDKVAGRLVLGNW